MPPKNDKADTATDKGDTVTETPTEVVGSTTDLATVSDNDSLSLADVIKTLGGGDWEVVVAGSNGTYWPAIPGTMCKGFIRDRSEIKSAFGAAVLYSVELTAPCNAVTQDGEVTKLPAGEMIVVLERAMLKKLVDYMHREVAIICDGKGHTKDKTKTLWSFRILARPLSPAEQVARATQNLAEQSSLNRAAQIAAASAPAK